MGGGQKEGVWGCVGMSEALQMFTGHEYCNCVVAMCISWNASTMTPSPVHQPLPLPLPYCAIVNYNCAIVNHNCAIVKASQLHNMAKGGQERVDEGSLTREGTYVRARMCIRRALRAMAVGACA